MPRKELTKTRSARGARRASLQRVEAPVEGPPLQAAAAGQALVPCPRCAMPPCAWPARTRPEGRPDAKPMDEFVFLLEAGRRDDFNELRGVQYEHREIRVARALYYEGGAPMTRREISGAPRHRRDASPWPRAGSMAWRLTG